MGTYSNQNEGAGDKFAQTFLPIAGTVIGDFFGPGGGLVGHQAGVNAGNLFATGDLAGAPAGSPASNLTNMGGLFQGEGLKGFGRYLLGNILDPLSSLDMAATATAGGGTAYYGTGSTPAGSVEPGLEEIASVTGGSNPYYSTPSNSGSGKSGGTGSSSIWAAGK